jgi:uncharacterized NAD(P)/FAD-binding protein YdhS
MTIHKSVAIVGGGYSGSLLAVNLLRHDGPAATLIERRAVFGRGAAYTAPNPSHLLNVRAANMSALRDQPQHFVDWCRTRGLGDGGSFIARQIYGGYVAELLAESAAQGGERLSLLHDDAVAGDVRADGVTVRLASGRAISVDVMVIAAGNLPPHAPPGLDPDTLPDDVYVPDPWASDVAAGLSDADTVLLLGSGLTMVDVALSLDAAGFGGRIVAMSRRGLLPRRHDSPAMAGARNEKPTSRASALLGEIRARSRATCWRTAVDELRPFTQALWQSATPIERARFLRHLRPWWDVHRHRLAPEVADRIAAMMARGQLAVIAAKPSAFESAVGSVTVTYRPRGRDDLHGLTVHRIVNCTGPQGDLARSTDPLLRGLIADGHARADPERLGLDVDNESRLIGVDGRAHDRLFALGPMTRGAFWEMIAVPDIRTQVWSVARKLSQAHWVGGEGL